MSDKELVNWEQQREKGKWFFVLRKAYLFTFETLVGTILILWLWIGWNDSLVYFLAATPILGFVAAISTWWFDDARYQNHILDKKIHDGLKL